MDALLHGRTDPDAKREIEFLTHVVLGGAVMPGLQDCRREVLDRLAIKHKVRGLLASAVLQDVGAPSGWKTWAAALMMAHEQDQKKLDFALSKTVTLISERFEPPIVLKGASLAFGAIRDTGDVDLLIHEQDLVPIIELLESKGYAYVGYDRNMYIKRGEYRAWEKLKKWSNQFEFIESETGTLIELHTAFFETSRVYDEDLSRLRAAIPEFTAASVTDPESGYRYLCPEDRLLLLALHVVLKRSPVKKEFIIRHIAEFRSFIGSVLDWQKAVERAKLFGVEYHLFTAIRLLATYSDSEIPAVFHESIRSELTRRQIQLCARFLRCMPEIDVYNRREIFIYRVVSPFILQGSTPARIQSACIFPLLLPPRYKLEKDYGFSPRSAFSILLYIFEPFRFFGRGISACNRRLTLKKERINA